MSLKERFTKKITMTVLQLQSTIVVTLLSTVGLVTIWPRFHDDAMSVVWYAYVIMIVIALIPLLRKS